MIEVVGLTKTYGPLCAVDRVSLELGPGDLYGLVGPGGSGKTTLLRMLATLVVPTAGEAYVDGRSIHLQSRAVRRAIGYSPQSLAVHGDWRVDEWLGFFAAAYGLQGRAKRRAIGEALGFVELASLHDSCVNAIPEILRRRLDLARMLLHDPRVLLLDEPFHSLPTPEVQRLSDLLIALRKAGRTIIVASNALPEIARVCRKIGILLCGELLFSGPRSKLLSVPNRFENN